ncbi:MAG: hypothetical protein IJU60_05165 [Acholeplasmatales bacterium]|nr:hypothetical protein [Acholeplasmatales bacterium]
MSNVGLKSNSKQMRYKVGNVDIYINLCKADKNIIIDIPFFSTKYPFDYDFGIVYNYQNRNINNSNFGYGVDYKIPKLRYIDTYHFIYVEMPDQSIWEYNYSNGRYICNTDKSYIEINNNKQYLYDKYGNVFEFNKSSTDYPTKITHFDGREILPSVTSTAINGFNLGASNRTVSYTFSLSNVTNASLSLQDIGVSSLVNFYYNSNKLTQLTYQPCSVKPNNVFFSFQDSLIVIEDRNAEKAIDISINGDQIVVTEKSFINNTLGGTLDVTTIDYGDYKTTVTDNFSNKTYYYFNNGISLYEFSTLTKCAKNYYINPTTELLTYESDYFKVKTTDTISLNSFSTSGVSISSYSWWGWIFSYYAQFLEEPYVISGSGYLAYNKTINGVMDDNYQLSMFVRVNSVGSFNVQLLNSNTVLAEQSIRKTTSDSEFELITIGLHLTTSVSVLTIKIITTNANVDVSTIRLVKKKFGTYYNYDSNNNLTSTLSANGTTTYTYNSYNQVSTITYPIGKTVTLTYDNTLKDKISKIEDNTNREIDYTYDSSNHNILTKTKKSSLATRWVKTSRTYNAAYDLATTSDELGHTISYSYNNHLLQTITYPYVITENMYYNNNYQLSKIIKGAGMVEYEYNSDLVLNKIKTSGTTNIDKSFDNSANLSEVDFFGLTINKYTYNNKNQISEIKYGTNSDKTTITYNSNSKISNIKHYDTSNVLKQQYNFTYDNLGNLIQKDYLDTNNSTITYATYTYDEDGRVKTNTSANLEYRYNTYDDITVKKIEQFSLKYLSFDKTFETTSTSLYNKRLDTFNIFPLNSDLISLNGNYRPYKFETENGYKTYEFRDNFNSNAFRCYNTNLAYQFGFSATGTMMIKLDLVSLGSAYVFANYDNYTSSNKIIVELSGSSVYLTVNNNTYSTGLYVSTGLNTIALSFDESITTNSSMTTRNKYIRVYVNGSTYEKNVQISSSFSAMTTYIGRSSGGNYKLNGYARNLAIREAYTSDSTLSSVDTDLDIKSMSLSQDKLDRLNVKKIKHGSSVVFTQGYNYLNNTDGLGTSNIVSSEIISTNNNSTTRTYTYDLLNRITAISDSLFGNHSYEYDYRGFLTSETSLGYTLTYTYDDNGNIKTIHDSRTNTTINLVYDQTYKDRLVTFDGNNISYSSTSPGNPTYYYNNGYTFEGKQLVHLQKYNNGEYKDIYYQYNDEGLIVKKTIDYTYTDDTEPHTEVTYYYYEDDKLVIEDKGYLFIEYLYDSNGNLYGFISNNNLYYYIKDILNNIIGIVNSSGNLVVRYDYDAYGYDVRSYGSYIYNPFKYKGYYYDSDAELYYCKSRFYNPLFRRWINNDDIENIDERNVGCVNLYAYCNNNPVMYVDPSGEMPTWLKFTIGGIVIVASIIAIPFTGGGSSVFVPVALGATAGGAAGMFSGFSFNDSGFNYDIDKASTGFMFGSIFGAVSGMSGATLSMTTGLTAESMIYRGVMVGVDGVLSICNYLSQNAINGSIDEITIIGVVISFSGGLLNFCNPISRFIDGFINPLIGSEFAWGYDQVRNSIIKKKKMG